MAEISARRIFQSPTDAAYFFGYFDTPQVSADGQRILALRCARIDRLPDGNDVAEVGWFEIGADPVVFHKIGETTAYNWQQGAMLQFLGLDLASRVIWNRFDGSKYVAEIVNLVSGARQTVPAIYNVFPDGRSATTIDFARHAWCRRGYSYGNLMTKEKNRPVVAGDGIWRVDLQTGARTQIIALAEIMALSPIGSMDGATHYLEHMVANPSGSHFGFLHRWRYASGIHSRLFVARADGLDMRLLNDSGRMSHFCWQDDTHILGYGGLANPVNGLRRNKVLINSLFRAALPLYKRLVRDDSRMAKALSGDAYLVFDITANARPRMVAPSMRAEDGHPAMLPGGHSFITDTYARNALGKKPKLIAINLDTDQSVILDELDSLPDHDESPTRCDLHPRVSPGGDIVSIDTMDRGLRGVYAYRLSRA